MKHFDMKLIFGIIMTVIYLGMAFLIMFSKVFSSIFDRNPSFKIIIGILFLVYGLFRGYRVWKMNS
jgi:hypothetical protein